MKAIGYAGARLYGCKYAEYSIVICAPDLKTARETFVLFLNNHGHRDVIYSNKLTLKPAKTLGNRPLYWAHVDVTV